LRCREAWDEFDMGELPDAAIAKAKLGIQNSLLILLNAKRWVREHVEGKREYVVRSGDPENIGSKTAEFREHMAIVLNWVRAQPDSKEVTERFTNSATKVIESLHYVGLGQVMIGNACAGSSCVQNHVMLRFTTDEDLEGNTKRPFVQLLIFIKHRMIADGTRKCGSDVYVRQFNGRMQATAAWRRKGSIEEYVQEATNGNANMWSIAVSGDNLFQVVKYFTDWQDPTLRKIVKSKSMFSFENGVYMASGTRPEDDNSFLAYPIEDLNHPITLPGACVPAKHFEGVFFPEAEWRASRATKATKAAKAAKYFA
jgi:hypothetical protein